MMIINESDEAKVFCVVGGHAIVKKEICQKIYQSLLNLALLKLTNETKYNGYFIVRS